MEEDRISKLPNAILQHILSLINLQQAVQTCILSKRWKNLWSSLPHLNFNFHSLAIKSGVHFNNPYESQWFMPRFTNFVTQFLSHRDDSSTIHKFQLFSSQLVDTNPKFVENCLDYVISHGVQHLDLDVSSYPTPFKFPDAFFASQTLRELRLRKYSMSIVIPKPFILPNLESLYLERFVFSDDDGDDHNIYDFPKEPFSGFPNLERLTLQSCKVSNLIIYASNLRILEISMYRSEFIADEAKMEHISTPKLTTFRYEGCFLLECSKVDFPLVDEVYLNISKPFYRTDKEMFLNSIKMLQLLGNARVVTLTLDIIEVLELDPQFLEQSQSPFPYIKCLKLIKGRCEFHPLKTVLKSVMNYLMKGCLYGDSVLKVELPEDVSVVEHKTSDESLNEDELGLRLLFTY